MTAALRPSPALDRPLADPVRIGATCARCQSRISAMLPFGFVCRCTRERLEAWRARREDAPQVETPIDDLRDLMAEESSGA